jgi:Delta7-sterol 5-desaturase
MSMEDRLYRAMRAAWGTTLGNLFWYALFAGALWLLFYVLLRSLARRRKIMPRPPSWHQVGWEVLYSLRSLFVFGVTGGAITFAALSGVPTQIYRHIEAYGWAWYVASLLAAVLVHDTYFYWTHRLLHHPWLFRRVHRVHHASTNPTPWAAYSFSISEAFVQAGIGPLLVFAVPMHYSAFGAFMLWQLAFNVFGHCGYEIFPPWFLRTRVGALLNTPTHHAMHHEKVGANFGLYFNVWDRLMGTNHPEYFERFEQVTAPAQAAAPLTDL